MTPSKPLVDLAIAIAEEISKELVSPIGVEFYPTKHKGAVKVVWTRDDSPFYAMTVNESHATQDVIKFAVTRRVMRDIRSQYPQSRQQEDRPLRNGN